MLSMRRFAGLVKECDRRGGESALKKISVSYNEYIHSIIWEIISGFCKYIQPTCTKCATTYDLKTYHLSYEFIGLEMYHLETLTVLCDTHHTLLHILLDGAQKNKQSLQWFQFPNIKSIMEKKGIDIYEVV